MTNLEHWYNKGQPAAEHTHNWMLEDIALLSEGEEAIFTCTCGGRRRIIRSHDGDTTIELDIPARVEAHQIESDLVNLLWGMTLGVAVVAALMGVAWIFTGRFWPE